MKNPKALTVNLAAYARLLKAIKTEIASGKKLIAQTLAVTNWNVGKYISDFILQGKDRAGYGEHVYEQLSHDLNIDKRTLHHSVEFSRKFPIVSARSQLPWTHYRSLLGLPDPSARQALVRKSLRKNLTSRQLQKEVTRYKVDHKTPAANQPIPKLNAQRGRLYTYTIEEVTAEAVFVDYGFNIIRKVARRGRGAGKLAAGDMIGSAAQNGAYTLTPLKETESALYTYKAQVKKITDADTLWVKIDAGFDTFTRRKVRLRGIDAPEINTAAGRRAKRFVEKLLKPCPFVVVKTYKDQSDKYDRYLVDVYFLAGESDPAKVAAHGELLNQRLLDEGLAVAYKE